MKGAEDGGGGHTLRWSREGDQGPVGQESRVSALRRLVLGESVSFVGWTVEGKLGRRGRHIEDAKVRKSPCLVAIMQVPFHVTCSVRFCWVRYIQYKCHSCDTWRFGDCGLFLFLLLLLFPRALVPQSSSGWLRRQPSLPEKNKILYVLAIRQIDLISDCKSLSSAARGHTSPPLPRAVRQSAPASLLGFTDSPEYLHLEYRDGPWALQ